MSVVANVRVCIPDVSLLDVLPSFYAKHTSLGAASTFPYPSFLVVRSFELVLESVPVGFLQLGRGSSPHTVAAFASASASALPNPSAAAPHESAGSNEAETPSVRPFPKLYAVVSMAEDVRPLFTDAHRLFLAAATATATATATRIPSASSVREGACPSPTPHVGAREAERDTATACGPGDRRDLVVFVVRKGPMTRDAHLRRHKPAGCFSLEAAVFVLSGELSADRYHFDARHWAPAVILFKGRCVALHDCIRPFSVLKVLGISWKVSMSLHLYLHANASVCVVCVV